MPVPDSPEAADTSRKSTTSEDRGRGTTRPLQTILATTPFLMALLDTDFCFLYVNRAYAEAGGHPADFYCKKRYFDLFPGLEKRRPLFAQVVETGKPCFMTADPLPVREASEDDPCYWDWSLVPVKNNAGQVEQLVLSLVEVTSRQVLEEENRRFRAIADHANCGVAVVNASERLQYVNQYMAACHGYAPEELIGKHLSIFHTETQMPEVRSILEEVCRTGACDSREVGHQHKDGATFSMLMCVMKLESICKKSGHIATTALDITPLKQLQQQLLNLESLAITGRLAACVAHENNSSLQAALFLLNRLESFHKNGGELTRETVLLKEAFEIIYQNNRNLQDLSRPALAENQPVNVNRIIQKSVKLVDVLLKKSQVGLRLDLDPDIPEWTGSPHELLQCLLNLFNNSLEAFAEKRCCYPEAGWREQPEKKQIIIKTRIAEETIVITVADNGPGVADENLAHLFDLFYTTKNEEGVGIGLTRCRELVENRGGSITAENLSGGGAAFVIRLPLSPSPVCAGTSS